jgi:hypothetical protein
MDSRPQHIPQTVSRPAERTVSVLGPASYLDWLLSLKRQSIVRVATHTGNVMEPAMVTNETPRYIFIGKLKFRRGDGWQVLRNARKCYRMRLRLVRDGTETFT